MRRIPLLGSLAGATILLTASISALGAEASTPAQAAGPEKTVSIVWSPAHLVIPVVHVTGEYRAMPKLGVAAIAGYGKSTVKDASGNAIGDSVKLWEAGARAQYYVLGDFDHGMQVGAQALYIGASLADGQLSSRATGLSGGSFLGYKIATHVGFTFDAQLGVQHMIASASATSGTASASASDSAWGPLLNLAIGWSF
jgi:hypothetical protein